MKNDIITNIKNVLSWTGFAVFVFWAICLLAVGNTISAVITLVLAFLVSPLRKKVFDKFNIGLKGKKLGFVVGVFFLSSCGTFIGLTEVEEPVDDTQVRVEESTAAADSEILESSKVELATVEEINTDSEEIEKTNSKTEIESEAESETATEIAVVEEIVSQTNDSEAEKDNVDKSASNKEDDISPMQVHFIDVGQGDATLITCDDEAMLIDAGDNSKGTTVQLYLKKQGIKKLKYLILTHPDADHIGGADVIITKFDIETVFMSDFTKDNKTYNEVIEALNYKSLPWSTPNVGNKYTLGSAEFTILAPNTTYSDPNNASIGLLLENGNDSFLFTGDAEDDAEYDILANGLNIDCDVYKAGHHGSKTASAKELLEAATPEYVVVSCAEGNSYGHPHAEPMNNFRSMGMKLFRTDEQGSVVATSDGKEITWNCAPADSWAAGENTQSSVTNKASAVTQSESKTVQTEASVAASASEQTVAVTPEPEPAPVVEPEPMPEPEPANDILVWKSATGEKYHSINNCGRMNPNKATQITKSQAESMGLGQCSKCW